VESARTCTGVEDTESLSKGVNESRGKGGEHVLRYLLSRSSQEARQGVGVGRDSSASESGRRKSGDAIVTDVEIQLGENVDVVEHAYIGCHVILRPDGWRRRQDEGVF
jgi:hypothetical protein